LFNPYILLFFAFLTQDVGIFKHRQLFNESKKVRNTGERSIRNPGVFCFFLPVADRFYIFAGSL